MTAHWSSILFSVLLSLFVLFLLSFFEYIDIPSLPLFAFLRSTSARCTFPSSLFTSVHTLPSPPSSHPFTPHTKPSKHHHHPLPSLPSLLPTHPPNPCNNALASIAKRTTPGLLSVTTLSKAATIRSACGMSATRTSTSGRLIKERSTSMATSLT